MDVLDVVREDRVIAVIRAPRVADPAGLASAVASAGIRCVEFTFTIGDVLDTITQAKDSGAVIGAGTVVDPEQARAAVDAGADFVVSPILALDVAGAVADQVPVFLAGFSPTEVHTAMQAGASAVKLFPARVGGPDYVADLLGPLSDAKLIPSGGIDEDNAREYLDAGAIAVYAGSALAPAAAVERGEHDEIRGRVQKLAQAVR